MKLREFIHALRELEADLQAELGDDVEPEVVCAIQPSYPLTATIDGVCVLDDENCDEPQLINGRPIVWIATGGHPHGLNPYAPSEVWSEI